MDEVQQELLQLNTVEICVDLIRNSQPDPSDNYENVEKACWLLKALIRSHHDPKPNSKVAERAAVAGLGPALLMSFRNLHPIETCDRDPIRGAALAQHVHLVCRYLLETGSTQVFEAVVAAQLVPELVQCLRCGEIDVRNGEIALMTANGLAVIANCATTSSAVADQTEFIWAAAQERVDGGVAEASELVQNLVSMMVMMSCGPQRNKIATGIGLAPTCSDEELNNKLTTSMSN